jgi:FkbM family methyltransferase
MLPSLYQAKKLLLGPHIAYMRRRERDQPPFARTMLEHHYYRRSMYDFMKASVANPEILVDADIDEHSVVVDAGAFVGEWSEQISTRYGSRIYAFEPNPQSSSECRARLGSHPNVELFECGLGGEDFTATLSLAGLGSSIYGYESPAPTAAVQIRDIVGVLDELGIEQVDLLKVNIEGGEYDLFDRLIEVDRLRRVRLVSVQFHEWHPGAYRRRRTIRNAFRRRHTEVWNFPWVWELWRRSEP